ncbi:hypothetical protein [Bradyrhizobium sp. 27S5]|uniref:hypothetical protein n=1 Tax=Bradyrhizobium sp. 27S5 TaxID=3139728 RepID=UPI0030CD8102
MSGGRFIISTGLRGKVERLLNGDVRSSDFHDLIFEMRDESGGSGTVSEIGNFIAHPLVRTQGIVWREVNDTMSFMRFRVPLARNRIITRTISSSVPDILRTNLRRIRKTALLQALGMKRAQAEVILERVLGRLVPVSVGRLSKLAAETKEEFEVVSFVASFIRGGPFFTDFVLFEDFCRALQKKGLIKASEKMALKRVRPALSIFALVVMHGRKVDLGDGTFATISIQRDMSNNLASFATAEIEKDIGRGRGIANLWVFQTSLPVSDWCGPDVAAAHRSPFIGDFELTAESKLGRVS